MKKIILLLKHKVLSFVESDTNKCLLYPFLTNDGYGDIQYRMEGKVQHMRAHRLVYQLKHNCILTKDDIIRHTCDTPACCNPRHLLCGTHADNVQDKVNKGRQAKGKTNGRYVHGYYAVNDFNEKPTTPFEKLKGRSLTIDQVILIKREIIKGKHKSIKELSITMGVKYQTIKDIYYGRTYHNVIV